MRTPNLFKAAKPWLILGQMDDASGLSNCRRASLGMTRAPQSFGIADI